MWTRTLPWSRNRGAILHIEKYQQKHRVTKRVTQVENQHRKIKGYRELTQEEIDSMNRVKAMGIELGELVESLRGSEAIDQRWVSIGATDLQTGLMALTRSIAKPDFF